MTLCKNLTIGAILSNSEHAHCLVDTTGVPNQGRNRYGPGGITPLPPPPPKPPDKPVPGPKPQPPDKPVPGLKPQPPHKPDPGPKQLKKYNAHPTVTTKMPKETNFESMTKEERVAAKMSRAAYIQYDEDETQVRNYLKDNDMDGWEYDAELSNEMAVVFHKDNKAAIAYRGTQGKEPLKDWNQNLRNRIGLDKILAPTEQERIITTQREAVRGKYESIDLTTGHSRGFAEATKTATLLRVRRVIGFNGASYGPENLHPIKDSEVTNLRAKGPFMDDIVSASNDLLAHSRVKYVKSIYGSNPVDGLHDLRNFEENPYDGGISQQLKENLRERRARVRVNPIDGPIDGRERSLRTTNLDELLSQEPAHTTRNQNALERARRGNRETGRTIGEELTKMQKLLNLTIKDPQKYQAKIDAILDDKNTNQIGDSDLPDADETSINNYLDRFMIDVPGDTRPAPFFSAFGELGENPSEFTRLPPHLPVSDLPATHTEMVNRKIASYIAQKPRLKGEALNRELVRKGQQLSHFKTMDAMRTGVEQGKTFTQTLDEFNISNGAAQRTDVQEDGKLGPRIHQDSPTVKYWQDSGGSFTEQEQAHFDSNPPPPPREYSDEARALGLGDSGELTNAQRSQMVSMSTADRAAFMEEQSAQHADLVDQADQASTENQMLGNENPHVPGLREHGVITDLKTGAGAGIKAAPQSLVTGLAAGAIVGSLDKDGKLGHQGDLLATAGTNVVLDAGVVGGVAAVSGGTLAEVGSAMAGSAAEGAAPMVAAYEAGDLTNRFMEDHVTENIKNRHVAGAIDGTATGGVAMGAALGTARAISSAAKLGSAAIRGATATADTADAAADAVTLSSAAESSTAIFAADTAGALGSAEIGGNALASVGVAGGLEGVLLGTAGAASDASETLAVADTAQGGTDMATNAATVATGLVAVGATIGATIGGIFGAKGHPKQTQQKLVALEHQFANGQSSGTFDPTGGLSQASLSFIAQHDKGFVQREKTAYQNAQYGSQQAEQLERRFMQNQNLNTRFKIDGGLSAFQMNEIGTADAGFVTRAEKAYDTARSQATGKTYTAAYDDDSGVKLSRAVGNAVGNAVNNVGNAASSITHGLVSLTNDITGTHPTPSQRFLTTLKATENVAPPPPPTVSGSVGATIGAAMGKH